MTRRLTTLFSTLALLAGVLACSQPGEVGSEIPAAQELPTFRVATIVWVGYGPIHLAQEKGFFEKHGVDVKLQRIEDTSARRAALSSGSVDASIDIVDSFANAASSGVPARVVLKLDDSMGGDGLIVRKEIDSIEDLRGKTVAYPPGQPSHFFLLTLLDEAGMSIDELDSRQMEADQAGAAFVSQSVDAAVTWEPWLTKAAGLPHGKILTTSREKPGLIVDVFIVRSNYLESNPEVVQGFIKGWFEAVEYWRANPEEANTVMARALGLEKDVFVQMVEGVRYGDLEGNREFFTRNEEGESAFTRLFARASEVWQREGVIANPVDPETVDGSELVLDLAQ